MIISRTPYRISFFGGGTDYPEWYKKFGGEVVEPGNIIIRQRGTKFHPGSNVGMGKDHTIFATQDGAVKFHTGRLNRMFVSVLPAAGSEGPSPEPAPAE